MAAGCGQHCTCLRDIGDPIQTASRPNVISGSANHGQGALRGGASSLGQGWERRPLGGCTSALAAPVPSRGLTPVPGTPVFASPLS